MLAVQVLRLAAGCWLLIACLLPFAGAGCSEIFYMACLLSAAAADIFTLIT
jgi:hypothetical protein